MEQTLRGRWLTIWLMLTLGLLQPGDARSQSLAGYYKRLTEYFSAYHMLPFPVWEGQQVGDFIDLQDLSVLKSAELCFGVPIGVRKVHQDHLPQLLQIDSQSGFLEAALNNLIGISLSGKGVSKVAIAFDDVDIETAAYDTLKQHLSAKCTELQIMFKNRQYPTVDGRPGTVVLGIMRARPTVALGLSAGGDVSARASGVKELLKNRATVIDLDPTIAARYQLEKLTAVSMTSTAQVTVAYKPASIPASTLGGGPEGQLEPFDENNAAHREQLKKVGNLWASKAPAKPWPGLFPAQP